MRGQRGGYIGSTMQFAEKIDRAVMPGSQGGPLMNVIAAKALCFIKAQTQEFIAYQKADIQNARHMALMFTQNDFHVVTGGTDNHLFMIDFTRSQHLADTLTGHQAEKELAKINVIINRNMIPFDVRSPMQTSGIRIGTPAITTRGFTTDDIALLVEWMAEVLRDGQSEDRCKFIRTNIERLCQARPLPNRIT